MAYSARGFGDSCGARITQCRRLRAGMDPPLRRALRGPRHAAPRRAARRRRARRAADRSHGRLVRGRPVDDPRGASQPSCSRTEGSSGGAAPTGPDDDRRGRATDRMVGPRVRADAERRHARLPKPQSLPPAGRGRQGSYLSGLFLTGQLSGFYAPRGEDPDANIPEQFDLIQAGEPYDSNPALRQLLSQTKRYHSAYYVEQGVPKRKRVNDAAADLQRVDGRPLPRRRGDPVREARPGAPSGQGLDVLRRWVRPPAGRVRRHARDRGGARRLFDRHLLGDRSVPGSPECRPTPRAAGARTGGRSRAATGESTPARWTSRPGGGFTSEGGDQATANAVDPIAGGGALPQRRRGRRSGRRDVPLPAAARAGYTLMGSPTAVADSPPAVSSQIAARLWDVAPDGTQTLVTRRVPPDGRTQAGLPAAPQRVALRRRARPEARAARPGRSVRAPFERIGFTVDVSRLRLELPVRSAPALSAPARRLKVGPSASFGSEVAEGQ